MKLLYSVIYNTKINWYIRNILFWLKPLLPSKFQLHPSGILKLKLNSYRFKLKTNQTSYISKELFWDGPNNYEYTTVFEKLVCKVDVLLDVGANIGYYTVLGATVNRALSIYAIEPSSGTFNFLENNIKLNGFSKRVKSFQLALSNECGSIEFFSVYNLKYPNISNLSGEHNTGTKLGLITKAEKVNAMSLDAFISENNLKKLDLIKIDTEGSENYIIESGLRKIEEFKPIIICETLFDTIEKELESTMTKLGYEFYDFYDSKLNKVPSIIRNRDNGVRNCFFVHPEKYDLIEEFLGLDF